jgi:ABC-2 type transport system permease protein
MTTTTHLSPMIAARTGATRVTMGRVLRAEAFKARTLRSLRWLLVGAVVSILAGGVTPALSVALSGSPFVSGEVDATGGALSGVSFTQLLAGALGVLVVSNEYATGLIRSTFAAVPIRRRVLVGKVAAAASASFAVSLAAVLAAFLIARAVLAGAGVSVPPPAAGVLRAVVGSALLLALTAAMGVAFGWLLRSTAGALAAIFAFLYLPPILGLLVPSVTPFLPSNAGMAILQTAATDGSLPPSGGLAVFTGYTAVLLVAATVLLERRDA